MSTERNIALITGHCSCCQTAPENLRDMNLQPILGLLVDSSLLNHKSHLGVAVP
jgi:hypothetical protein